MHDYVRMQCFIWSASQRTVHYWSDRISLLLHGSQVPHTSSIDCVTCYAKYHFKRLSYITNHLWCYKPHVQHSCQWASQCLLYLVFITVTFSFRTL